MKVTILGTANAWGPNPLLNPPAPWPMMGILSNGTQIEIRKYRTSLLVESDDGKRILVDCGPDFSHQLRGFQLGIVDAVLITHAHLDHIGGLDELNLYRRAAGRPIPVYATGPCWDYIKNRRGLAYVIDPLRLIVEKRLIPNPELPSFQIGSVTITPFAVEHSAHAPGAVGFVFEESTNGRMKRTLYTGDLWDVSNPTLPVFRQPVDVAIIECDRWAGPVGPNEGGGHMSFEEAARWLHSGVLSHPRPKQVVFVHFGDNGPKGTGSTYRDWREAAIGLLDKDLQDVMPNPDAVIGYEGLIV